MSDQALDLEPPVPTELPQRRSSYGSALRQLRPWFASLFVFYGAWLTYVVTQGQWATVTDHWPIAAAMAAGSYFAGSTPMGGGTVGFPVLVLFFDMPVEIGRNFSLMVQSIGMVSASIFIIARRTTVAWRILGWAMASSAVALPLGLHHVAPLLPGLVTTLLFAVIWCSFGILHIVRIGEIDACVGPGISTAKRDAVAGILIGIIGGGGLTAATGVGIDMLLYTILVAMARADIKVAVPTSVILMAFNSVVGFGTAWSGGLLQPEVWGHWLAAAPVVALGAPGGAWAVQYLSRRKTLLLCSVLMVFQFVWTCIDRKVVGLPLTLSLAGIGAFYALFTWLFRWSGRGLPAAAASDASLLAVRDPVTGTYGEPFLMEQMRRSWAQAARHQRSLSVLIMDLKDLADIEREHGAVVRDLALRALGEALSRELRSEDLVGRTSAHAFVALVESDADGAQALAQRVREALREESRQDGAPVPSELRMGIATRVPDGSGRVEDLVEQAERSLGAGEL